MDTNMPAPSVNEAMSPVEDSQSSFLSRYVMVLSILLIIGTTGIIIYMFVGKKPASNLNNPSVSILSPNCTNEKIYTDVKEAILEEGSKVCYIDAKAPDKEYVFPSDIVKHDNTRNLVSLKLDGYNLSAMRESLEVLKDLKVLKLTNAKLTILPAGIDKLSNLKELDLSGNEFTETTKQEVRQKLLNVKIIF